jgi:hypothetical protein
MRTRNHFILVLLLFMTTTLINAQDNRLWGEWTLESMEQAIVLRGTEAAPKTFSLEEILQQKGNLPEELPLVVYIVDDGSAGICSTAKEYAEYMNVNDKGTCTSSGGRLVLKMNREEERGSTVTFDYAYTVENGLLTLKIDQQSRETGKSYKRTLSYKKRGTK